MRRVETGAAVHSCTSVWEIKCIHGTLAASSKKPTSNTPEHNRHAESVMRNSTPHGGRVPSPPTSVLAPGLVHVLCMKVQQCNPYTTVCHTAFAPPATFSLCFVSGCGAVPAVHINAAPLQHGSARQQATENQPSPNRVHLLGTNKRGSLRPKPKPDSTQPILACQQGGGGAVYCGV